MRNRFAQSSRSLTLIALALVTSTLFAACGDGDATKSDETDKAFVQVMIPLDRMVVDAAQAVYVNGDNRKVRSYARDIVNFEMAEIGELNRVGKTIGVTVDPKYTGGVNQPVDSRGEVDAATTAALETLGLTTGQAGLAGYSPKISDAAFVDLAIEHHKGAIRVARVELEKGAKPELKAIARNVVSSQSREIEELRRIKPGS